MRILLGIIMILLLGGSSISCCHMNKETKTLYGWGKFKDKDIEMESDSPLKSFVNLSGINQ